MKRYTTLLLLAGLVQACKVTRDYSRPELDLPVAFYQSGSENDSSRQAEIPDYASFFKNKDLVVLLDSVISGNLDLRIASENIQVSEATLKNVKLSYLPDLNLQINTGLQRLSKNSMMGSFAGSLLFEDYTLGPVFSWEIDFWGKLKRQREEALADYLAQNEVRRGIRVQLIAQTAQVYYHLLSLDEQLKITRDVEKAMDETLQMLKVQYSVGEANSLSIRQSEAQLAEVRALIPEIQGSIRAQENALQLLAGNYPGTIKRSGHLDDVILFAGLKTGVPIDLLSNRPDVKQREHLLQASGARMGIARTNFYPALMISGQGGLNSIRATEWFSIPASLFGNATAGLTQPVFNRRRIRSAYEQAVHNREMAVLEFRKSVVSAVEEVSTVLSTIESIRSEQKEVANRTETMSGAIEDAQVLYQYGEASYLEVLSVQQLFFQAQMARTATYQKEINAYIALYKSLGGN